MTERPCLVFDIGGTNLRAALYDASSDSLQSVSRTVTPGFEQLRNRQCDSIYRALVDAIHIAGRALLDGRPPAALGIAFAGPVDERGRVVGAPTIWREAPSQPIDLAADLQAFWPGSGILVANDVTAAGMRYCSPARQDFCIVTVSSGIGNKIFIGGKPFSGPAGRGGEIGHLRVAFDEDAPLCDCGGRGHLGAIASGRGTLRLARDKAQAGPGAFAGSEAGVDCGGDPGRLTNPILAAAFRNADPWAVAAVREPARHLGRALAGVHLALGVERFIIYGGFGLALGAAYRQWLAEVAAEACWNAGQDWTSMIALAEDGENAGLIGAGRLASDRFGLH